MSADPSVTEPVDFAEPHVDEDEASSKLARPIDFSAKYGQGANRTVVLGGGGVYFVAWQVAYLNGLAKAGVDFGRSDIIVGTSAGSLVASILSKGGLRRFSKQVDLIARVPALVGLLAPASNFHPSQLRALEMFREADNARPETIRAIGHAALAAHTPTAAEMRRSTGFAIAARGWPSPALRVSSVDCYTGERLIISGASGVSAIRAAAGSSAVPGIFSPQPILDRKCMDGGVSGSGTHCDVVAGAKKAFIVSLGAVVKQEVATMTISPDALTDEVAQLEASGTSTHVRGPRQVDLKKLMDPLAVPEAIAMGEQQAADEAPQILAFWN